MTAPGIRERVAAFEHAIELADGRVHDTLVADGRAVVERATERLRQGDEHIVIALAGGTGSGKSSLFNRLADRDFSSVGPVRPVTEDAVAWSVGDGVTAGTLLDWLQVRHRHHDRDDRYAPAGTVLVDLPDIDSISTGHRAVADRLIDRVDVLVWVVDPLKYAQRRLHDGYLRRLAEHADVTFVVLNRVDEVADVGTVEDDLARLLAEDGLAEARILTTSATEGTGVDRLRRVLWDEVRDRTAVAARITADLRSVAQRLRDEVGEAVWGDVDVTAVVDAVILAVDAEGLARRAARDFRAEGMQQTQPWISAAIRLPSRLLRRALGRRRGVLPSGGDEGSAPPSPVGLRHALIDVVDDVTATLPVSWGARLRGWAAEAADDLGDGAKRAVDAADLPGPERSWWSAYALLWTTVELAPTLGLLWLAALLVLDYLQLPRPPAPSVRGLPLPTALVVYGGIAWASLALLRRPFVALGARRHLRRVERALREELAAVVDERIGQPLLGEMAVQRDIAGAIEKLT